MQLSNHFLIHLTIHSWNPFLSNLERRMLWVTMSKALQKINDICNLSLVHQYSHFIKEVKFHFHMFFCALWGYSDPSEHQGTASNTTNKNSPPRNSLRPWIAAMPTIWATVRAGQEICSRNILKEICCVTVLAGLSCTAFAVQTHLSLWVIC